MTISLVKGQKIDLTKNNSTLKQLLVGLGWDPVDQGKNSILKLFSSKANIDIDVSVLMLKDDKLKTKNDIVFFGNLRSKCGGVTHMGDNLTGGGNGDDEQILIDLSKVPKDVNKLIFVTNIYECIKRKQHFGMIKNAFIRIADNNANNKNIAMYNLTDDYNDKTALIVGEVYRHNQDWKFAAIGEGTKDTALKEMLNRYL